jgi:hypothetical protein
VFLPRVQVWTTVNATLDAAASSVALNVPETTTAVRYAWHDFVDCVLVNDADLPMGPWKLNLTSAEKSTGRVPKHVNRGRGSGPIQSPPLGFNSWVRLSTTVTLRSMA